MYLNFIKFTIQAVLKKKSQALIWMNEKFCGKINLLEPSLFIVENGAKGLTPKRVYIRILLMPSPPKATILHSAIFVRLEHL